MPTIVLIRHGQSVWNLENRFTGWTDVDLSAQGLAEARAAGTILRDHRFIFDIAFTSVLKRAIRTLWVILDEMNLMWIPVEKTWKLNERHYGALQGLNKAETTLKYGEDQVMAWRRSAEIRPPFLDSDDPRCEASSVQYNTLKPGEFPFAENLIDTETRVVQYWLEYIAPAVTSGKSVLIAAHGNSLRALVKYLDDVSAEEITGLNIPTGTPLVYELDEHLKPLKHYYLEASGD